MSSFKKKFLYCLASLPLVLGVSACGEGHNSSSSQQASKESVTSSVNDIDMNQFPNFMKDVSSIPYQFEEKQMREPFFWGNVIYNESAMMVEGEDGTISCQLRYQPQRVISIHDYTWTKEYVEGKDYEVSGNKILWKKGSEIPFWTESQLKGEGIPEPYRKVDQITNMATDYVLWSGVTIYTESPFFYSNQIHVTYAYDIHELNRNAYPTYCLDRLPKFKEKLEGKQDVKIVTIGDSISEGCSSSGLMKHEPFMGPWVPQVADALGKAYGSNVTMVNQSVGGTTAGYVSSDPSKLQAIKDQNPDVVFIHYGVNDLGNSETPNGYGDLMLNIILYIQDELPDTEIVLLSPIMPNPYIYDSEKMTMYEDKLHSLANDYSKDGKGIAVIDVNKASLDYFDSRYKRYEDYTANGINHPNDFGHRFYVQCVLGAFVDPTKLARTN